MEKLTNKRLDRCMETILDHLDEFGMWSDNELVEYCQEQDNIDTIYSLEAQGHIIVEVSNCEPETISITGTGRFYFINKKQKRKEFIIKSIIVPIIISIITTFITLGITHLFTVENIQQVSSILHLLQH